MSGYVRLHRSLVGHPAFRNDSEAMAFAWLVSKAAWKPIRVRYKERSVMLGRGQLSVSQRDMAVALDRDKGWVERLWRRLRDEAMIDVAYEAGAAVITICNYAKYQCDSDGREAVNEAPRKADARQTQGTEQEREKYKKEETTKVVKRASAPTKPPEVSDGVWSDFLALRRQKRAPFTETALAGVIREVEKLPGWTLERALSECCQRGWQSFKSDWIEENGREQRNGHRQPNSGQGLRGSRPDPALDMYRDALRREAEEGSASDTEDGFGTGFALPSFLAS